MLAGVVTARRWEGLRPRVMGDSVAEACAGSSRSKDFEGFVKPGGRRSMTR
jgi:hypothetical protein